ncbi:MAG: bifunctional UDP-3-O-[3-hydroxymyristoyl] N-acetylglucosamine deacetylase/3-hydroxyacyl-ACP dehydratase [Candidatus Krumholzibacteria bacterium]
MTRQQRTIEREFSIEGLGLHTGEHVALTLKPAPVNSGIRFVHERDGKRVEIPAVITSVALDKLTPRNTTIRNGDAAIYTVEHLLAACYGLHVDNLLIEISANEPPVPKSGSYESYVQAFKRAGFVSQDAPVNLFEVDHLITHQEDGIEIYATPSDTFRVSFTIQFQNKFIGTQYASFEVTPEVFEKEISPARTFVLGKDIEELRQAGLIKGGSLDNAIVFNDEGMVNEQPLRFPDECVRHKVLDLIGDLSLLGASIRGHIHAVKSGHSSNLRFVKKLWDLKEERRRWLPALDGGQWDTNLIREIIPHRYPFLLVDRIIEVEANKRIVGIKNVTINEPFFAGHFPGHPIMPAVLILESMAQVGGLLVLNTVDNPKNYLVYFTGLDKARFRKPVLPGDQLRLEIELVAIRMRVCKMRGKAYVGDELVAEAEMLANIVPR